MDKGIGYPELDQLKVIEQISSDLGIGLDNLFNYMKLKKKKEILFSLDGLTFYVIESLIKRKISRLETFAISVDHLMDKIRDKHPSYEHLVVAKLKVLFDISNTLANAFPNEQIYMIVRNKPKWLNIIKILYLYGPCIPTLLAKYQDVSTQNISTTLLKMKQMGIVEILDEEKNFGDRRSRYYSLTTQGYLIGQHLAHIPINPEDLPESIFKVYRHLRENIEININKDTYLLEQKLDMSVLWIISILESLIRIDGCRKKEGIYTIRKVEPIEVKTSGIKTTGPKEAELQSPYITIINVDPNFMGSGK